MGPPAQTDNVGQSTARTYGTTVSNQKFREVKDTLSVTQPRCKHMRFVPCTELIMAVQGALAVEARVEVIRETMMELSVEAPEFTPELESTSDKAYSLESGFDTLTKSEASGASAKPTLFD